MGSIVKGVLGESYTWEILLANREEALKIFVLTSSRATENREFYEFANSILGVDEKTGEWLSSSFLSGDSDVSLQSNFWQYLYSSQCVLLLSSKTSNASTWTTRYVKQNRELQRFLLEQGVYLISNWAILNDTNTKQVSRILSEFHNLTPIEVEQAALLLSSYHLVYRRDRLKNRQGKGGKCQTPSIEQLERIATLIKQKAHLVLNAEQTLSKLEQLQSLDNETMNTEGMQVSIVSDESDLDSEQSDFLKSYQQQFQRSLDSSIEEVITTRLSKFKGKKVAKAPQFITALDLFHCQGESMSAIASAIGLQAQYQVTRLLKLKELRIDIRHNMLQLMRDWTLTQTKLENLESLKQREQEIEVALSEQIDLVLDEAEKEVSIADSNQSILAKRIFEYVDRLNKLNT